MFIRHKYFDTPTQVKFLDPDNNEVWVGGIAIEDYIICGCCGGTIDLDEVYEFAPEGVNPIEVYEDWVDLSVEIIG